MALESDTKFEEKHEENRFGKQHEEFGKFSPDYLKVGTQNWDFYEHFYSKQKMYELKIHRGVMRYDNEKRSKI